MLSANDRAFYRALAEQFARSVGGPPADLASFRAMIAKIDAQMAEASLPDVGAYHATMAIRDGLTTEIAVPHGDGPFPVLVHCHGGGGLASSAEGHRGFSHACARRGFLTFMIDYRLAPEHRFPAAFEDIVEAVSWVAANASRYGGDAAQICLSGNSSGAGLAFSAARALAAQGGPRLRGLVGLDGRYDRTGPQMEWMLEALLGPDYRTLALDPRVSPGQGLVAGELPPTLLISGSADHTAPSTLEFARTLLTAGAHFQLNLFEGSGHDFMRWAGLDVAREGLDAMFGFLAACVAMRAS